MKSILNCLAETVLFYACCFAGMVIGYLIVSVIEGMIGK